MTKPPIKGIDFTKPSKLTHHEITCCACPFQGEGTFNTGEHFYYRERWEYFRFEIYNPNEPFRKERDIFEIGGEAEYFNLGIEKEIQKIINVYNKKKSNYLKGLLTREDPFQRNDIRLCRIRKYIGKEIEEYFYCKKKKGHKGEHDYVLF